MQVLLDTHIYLWFVGADKLLPTEAISIMDSAEAIYVSSATLWEIAIKVRTGKLKVELDELVEKMGPSGFHSLPILPSHTTLIAKLPMHHRDPFDRMLVAQAISEEIWLLTSDRQLRQYSDRVVHV